MGTHRNSLSMWRFRPGRSSPAYRFRMQASARYPERRFACTSSVGRVPGSSRCSSRKPWFSGTERTTRAAGRAPCEVDRRGSRWIRGRTNTRRIPTIGARTRGGASFEQPALRERRVARQAGSIARECRALGRDELGDALRGKVEQRIHLLAAKRVAFRGALDFDEAAAVVHHDIHVGVARGILGVIQIEYPHALPDADRDGRARTVYRVARQAPLALQPAHRIDERDVRAGDRGGARAAVRLQHVAVERDRAFAECGAIDTRAQRTADEALDLERAPALLAARRFALGAFVGRARQHAVLRRDPAFALAAQE